MLLAVVVGQALAAERLPGLAAPAAAVVYPPSGLAIYEFRAQDALYALLLRSANDVASALPENANARVAGFVEIMNQRARWLGARNTRFVNANARNEIVRTTNGLLGVDPDMVEGKTGYADAAGHCFVGLVRRGPYQVMVVVPGSRDLWAEVRRLTRRSLGLLGKEAFDPELSVLGKSQALPESATIHHRCPKGVADPTLTLLSTNEILAARPGSARTCRNCQVRSSG